MKETSEFHLIESEPFNIYQADRAQQFFQQEKIAYQFGEFNNKEVEQQSLLKSPKSKRGRKFLQKSNPQDNSASKTVKIKQKKYKNMVPDRQKNPNQLFGHWSVDQNKRYHWFLQIHHSHFMNRSLRRMDRIFTTMAKFVATRQAQQCRSHHQKMEKKHKTFTKILMSLRMSHYSDQADISLREQIDKNQVPIIEPLLTQQFLMKNLTLKQAIRSNSMDKQEQKFGKNQSNSEQSQSLEQEFAQKIEAQIIEQVMAPQYESSKNYFKLMPQNQERNDILDDGYERNLPFNGFF